MRDNLEGSGLDLPGQGLPAVGVGRAGKCVAQAFDLFVARPSEPGPFAAASGNRDVGDRVGDVHGERPGMKQVPAALQRRIGDGATGSQRTPVHGLEIDHEAGITQGLRRDQGRAVEDGDIGGLQDRHRRTFVAGCRDQLPGLVDIVTHQRVAADGRLEGRAARQHGRAGLVVGRVSDRRSHVVFLVDEPQDGFTNARIVERRMEMVHPQPALDSERIQVLDDDPRRRFQDRQQVVRRQFEIVDLTRHQCVHCRGGIRDVVPLDPIDPGALGACCEARRLGAGHVVRITDIDHPGSRDPFVLHENERPGAQRVGNLLKRIHQGVTLRHHERHVRADLAE